MFLLILSAFNFSISGSSLKQLLCAILVMIFSFLQFLCNEELLESLCIEKLFLLLHLFNYLFMKVCTHEYLYLFYSLSYKSITTFFFNLAYILFFQYAPILFLWSIFLLSGIMKCSRSSCIFLAQLWKQPLECRTLVLLLGEGCLETKIWVLISSFIAFFLYWHFPPPPPPLSYTVKTSEKLEVNVE